MEIAEYRQIMLNLRNPKERSELKIPAERSDALSIFAV